MKKFFSVSFISILCLFTVHAQNNYCPGLIITNSNDTLKGFIDCGTDSQNARICYFKSVLTDSAQTFLPGEITSYQFTSKIKKTYVSKSVTLNGTSSTVFLETLVQGTINLYYFTEQIDKKAKPYYVFENENGETNIITKNPDEIIEFKNSISKLSVDNNYKGTLHYIFRNFEVIGKKAHTTEFKQKDLIKLTKEYNKLVGVSMYEYIDYKYEYKSFAKLDYSVIGGIEYGKLVNGLVNWDPNAQIVLEKIMPSIGAQVNVSIPKWIRSLSLQTDLSLNNTMIYSFENYEYNRHNLYLISLGLGVKYTYQGGIFHPSIESGFRFKYPTNPQIWGGYIRSDNYIAVGLNPSVGKKHFLLFNVGYKFKGFPDGRIPPQYKIYFANAWTMKLGYTF